MTAYSRDIHHFKALRTVLVILKYHFPQGTIKIGWSVTFFIIALIAGVLGFSGIAGAAVNIAWILFVVGLVVAIVFLILGRKRPPL